MSSTTADRYTIISSDCHAGGNHAQYREYLDPAWIDEFDAWRGRYKNPFRDLQDDGRSRNWDDERRIREMDADGIVGEVVFPNTVPPFFPTGRGHRPGPDRPRSTRPAWPASGPTTGGWPTSARPTPPVVPASPRSCSTTWTRPWPTSAGPRTTACPGVLLPGRGPEHRHRPALRPHLRPPVGRVPGARAARDPPRWRQRRARPRTLPLLDDHVHPRGRLLRQPGPVAPDHVGRLRPVPRPGLRHDRAGHRLDPRRARPHGLHPRLAW